MTEREYVHHAEKKGNWVELGHTI